MPDSNCLIAIVSPWHVHHLAAQAEVGRRLDHGETMFLAAPALVEAYAVLTRLPIPLRISPTEAHRVLEANFLAVGTIVTLDDRSYRTLLDRSASDGIAGGRIYDAVIALCAERAGVKVFVTFNEDDFAGLVAPGIDIVVPGRSTAR